MIRSLAYFLPVIEEVLAMRVSPDYFQYLRHKLQTDRPKPGKLAESFATPDARLWRGRMENQPARLRRG